MIKKVVIWGHKLFSHTNGYVFNGYYKAFKSLGYDVQWFNDFDNVTGISFENCLFLTEDQAQKNIPLVKGSYYVLHHCNPEKYLAAGCIVLNLCNYVKYCEDGVSFNYKDKGNTVEKLGNMIFYDKKENALYQTWATDLLPHEIDENDIVPFKEDIPYVNYVGTQYDNVDQVNLFLSGCGAGGKKFVRYELVSDERHKIVIRDSFIAPDIRGEWHKECGYIPCRVFKNISYGKQSGTNSTIVRDLFEGMIPYNDSPYELFFDCVKSYRDMDKEVQRKLMLFVKEKHTYINRINNIFNVLGIK